MGITLNSTGSLGYDPPTSAQFVNYDGTVQGPVRGKDRAIRIPMSNLFVFKWISTTKC